MECRATPLAGALLIEPELRGDERGFFQECWNRRAFAEAGCDWDFVQDNHSRSRGGVLRGMHYQTRQPQGKLVRVVAGAVFDAVVDLRRGSGSFGQWYGTELSAENRRMLYVPPGCAHGFYVLSASADFLYKTTTYRHPQSEVCLAWDDPTVAIEWPLERGRPPVLSDRDRRGLRWAELPCFD